MIETFLGDIVFLVDTSSQMGTSNFQSQKQFVKLVAKSLNVGPERSRAAIITYGNTSTQLDDSDLFSSLPEFYRAVDGSRFIGGPRRMNYAVDGAEKLLRTANRNVYKLVVLLTAGKQFYQQDIILLEQSFKKLRETGTKTFVVAIGSDYDNTELLPGVETAEDIFSVVSFDGLARQAWETSKEIAERTGEFCHERMEEKRTTTKIVKTLLFLKMRDLSILLPLFFMTLVITCIVRPFRVVFFYYDNQMAL